MHLCRLEIQNYRGLRKISIPMSRFGCLIGENNTGKSSVLQALSLFRSGATLAKANFFDESQEIRIALSFREIGPNDLKRIADEHRTKVETIIHDSSLTLVRIYDTDGKNKLKYETMVPDEDRFSPDNIDALLSKQKASKAFADKVIAAFPELKDSVTASMNQGEVRIAIQNYAASLPTEKKRIVEMTLPTGIDESVIALIPDILYIPAVKDLADDVKTTQSTPFGKVLGILLKAIEPKLAQAKELFDELNQKLNRITHENGLVSDLRLEEMKIIERTVEKYVQESFANVSLEIRVPPPELRTVLAGAQILADDGVRGPIETKGDGLRRAIVFAILRSFVHLEHADGLDNQPGDLGDKDRYLLLFEEPELYLHPTAQQILFEALNIFSRKQHVLVTTHAPAFFGPDATATFIKMSKVTDTAISPKPFACEHAIDLRDINAKDQFQIICYENNNIAFFANTIVLVEGDSDYLVLPHLAKILDILWDCGKTSVRFARINGKTSIRRYKNFFSRFNTRIFTITDLDLILSGFDQIDPTAEMETTRRSLLSAVDAAIASAGSSVLVSANKMKKAHDQGDIKSMWSRASEAQKRFENGKATFKEVSAAVAEFFAWQHADERLAILVNPTNSTVRDIKAKLLRQMRAHGVFVLEKGEIEAYYPTTVTGSDKPTKAQSFCNVVKTRDAALALCPDIDIDGNGTMRKEFEVMFSEIFSC